MKHKISAKHTYITHVHSGVDSSCLLSVLKLDIFVSCTNDNQFSWIINCSRVLKVQTTNLVCVYLRRCFQVWMQLPENLCFVYSLPNIIRTDYICIGCFKRTLPKFRRTFFKVLGYNKTCLIRIWTVMMLRTCDLLPVRTQGVLSAHCAGPSLSLGRLGCYVNYFEVRRRFLWNWCQFFLLI